MNKILTLLLFITSLNCHSGGISKMVSSGVEISNTITRTEARMIFTGKITRWSDGSPIQVFILPRENTLTTFFLFENLGVSPNYYFDAIENNAHNGKNNKIIQLEGEDTMIITVATRPGAVGYIGRSTIIKYGKPVKEIKIIQ